MAPTAFWRSAQCRDTTAEAVAYERARPLKRPEEPVTALKLARFSEQAPLVPDSGFAESLIRHLDDRVSSPAPADLVSEVAAGLR